MIWTTTPWTLPANVAVAVHPEHEYTAVGYHNPKTQKEEITVLADKRAEEVMSSLGIRNYNYLGKIQGRFLEGKKYRHPFMDRTSPIVLADYVTLSDGTGCVHTAPGHGQEDYFTGIKYHLPMLSPVDEKGVFTKEAGEFAGLNILKEGNDSIIKKLETVGALLDKKEIAHSYPHCWRCDDPVIFRATEQWFVSLDYNSLRQRVLGEIKRTKWIPSWGESRMGQNYPPIPDRIHHEALSGKLREMVNSGELPCAINFLLTAAYYLAARFPDDFESAVLHAQDGGGQNMLRACLTGRTGRRPGRAERNFRAFHRRASGRRAAAVPQPAGG